MRASCKRASSKVRWNRDTIASERFAQFAAEGSHSALAEALDLVAPELLRTARLLTGRADEAAELVQDTFLAAIESRHRFERGRELVPWLVGIMQNLHRHRSRAQARQIDPEHLPPPSESDPSVLVDRKLVREQIERGIAQLPPTYQQVVALHLRDGLRPEEIGRLLDRPAGRIRTQLWRGLRQLRDRLPGGLATALVAFLSVASARARSTVDVTGSDRPPDDDASHPSGAPRSHDRLRRATRLPRRWLAIVASLACALAVALWLSSGAGLGRERGASTPGTATIANAPSAAPAPAAEDAARRIVVTEDPSASRGIVRAHLVWADTSQPAAQQSVRIQTGYRAGTSLLQTWFDTVRESTTDADGNVSFENVPAGTARLLFDDAFVRSPEFTVPAGGTIDRTERLAAVCDIDGIVVDGDGQPFAGAEVWMSTTSGRSSPGFVATRTAADGKFALRALDQRWAVWATAAGHARSAVVSDPKRLRAAHPQLVLLAAPAAFDGVARTRDGVPVAGALVAAFPLAATRAAATTAAPAFVRADAEGRFFVSGLEPGPLLVVVRGASTCASADRFELAPDATAHTDRRLGSGATVRGRAGGGSTAGAMFVAAAPRLPDPQSGVLSMLSVTTPVSEDGTYCLEHVFPGVVDIQLVRLPKYELLRKVTVDVVEGGITEVDLQPEQQIALAGRVVDAAGSALAGIEVMSMPAEFDWTAMRDDFARTITDVGGGFVLPARQGVAYRCVARQERGFVVATSDAVAGSSVEVRLSVATTLRAAASIRGVLGLASVPMELDLWQLPLGVKQRVEFDSDGRFTFERLPPGDFALFAVWQESGSRLATFHLAASEVLDLGTLAVAPAGTLQVSLRRADGRPVRVAGFIVARSRRDGIALDGLAVGRDGIGTLQLAADGYEVAFTGVDFLPERRMVEVAAGQRSELVVPLRPARTCSFTFTTDQRQHGRLWVRITSANGTLLVDRALPAITESAYHVAFGLPPGSNHVHAVTPGGLVADGDVVVPDGNLNGPPLAVEMALH